MNQKIAAFVAAGIMLLAAGHAAAAKESDYQTHLCADMAMEIELAAGGRVDCISHDFAIEVDFSEKWHQAVGQSLYYASQTGRSPAIILICRKAERLCLRHSKVHHL